MDLKQLEYFRRRLQLANRDAKEAIEFTVQYCDSSELQFSAVQALQRKCEILWVMLDSIQGADINEQQDIFPVKDCVA